MDGRSVFLTENLALIEAMVADSCVLLRDSVVLVDVMVGGSCVILIGNVPLAEVLVEVHGKDKQQKDW